MVFKAKVRKMTYFLSSTYKYLYTIQLRQDGCGSIPGKEVFVLSPPPKTKWLYCILSYGCNGSAPGEKLTTHHHPVSNARASNERMFSGVQAQL
jgi:hypothetical protein